MVVSASCLLWLKPKKGGRGVSKRKVRQEEAEGSTAKQSLRDVFENFLGDERLDSTYLAMMADIVPSMPDTLLRNGGLYDAHALWEKIELWAENPRRND
ncbi:thioesterase family protein [Penicillium lagena]|uniref:thioesterase family protein n=1 Tax=Penicillium lagena TaxID=94218 RepID=UPI002540CE62|nr:thioesterase family protein [Penicillium lagena]KAJ5605615.1 thioesterase family protein [Penicillium lagena]